ncbi:MAG: metallophosphoesterase [Pseudomonadota bacterium]
MITRRFVIRGLLASLLAGLIAASYGFFIEPALRLRVTRWRLSLPGWTAGPLRIAILADIHVGAPIVSRRRLRQVVTRTNALGADLILFLGDLEAGHRFVTEKVPLADAAAELAGLDCPLGVYAILGNHDWWHDAAAQTGAPGLPEAGRQLEAAGIPVLENEVRRFDGFWLAGLGDQLAYSVSGRGGRDDLPGTLTQAQDDAPVILMAHEPDIFARMPDRVGLTLSGHTHGGQVRIFGFSPLVPSQFGNRYAYGHVIEDGRHLIVSGGIGCSILPVRLGVVPEITVLELS